MPGAVVAVPEAERPAGHHRGAGGRVQQDGFERGVLGVAVVVEVGRGEELARHVGTVAGLQLDQEREVGVALHVVGEVRHLPLHEELPQDHVPHRHGQCAVGARPGGEPLVGELHVVRVVRGDRDHLLAPVAGLGHPVRVRCAGDRQVRTPHDEIPGVPPVARLGHVGLVAEHLRGRHREVGVPVVERQHRPAEQGHEPGPGGVRDHRHRGDRGEPGDPVRAVPLDRVHVRRRDEFGRLVPRGPHEAALAARGLVPPGAVGVFDDVRPGEYRVTGAGLGLPVHLQQHPADVGVAHAGGGVGVPGERRAARAAARFVLGPVRADGGVVGLLRLPGDDPVLDVHLPRARPRAVHPVGGAHDLVVAPPVPVERVGPASADLVQCPQVLGDVGAREEPAGPDQRVGEFGVQARSGGVGAAGGGVGIGVGAHGDGSSWRSRTAG